MNPDDLRQTIEMNIVDLLKKLLADGKITENRGKQISTVVLELLKPGMTLPELYKAILKLDDSCPELSEIVLPYAKSYEDQITQKATEAVSQYIRLGQYDAAAKLAEKAIRQEIPLKYGSAKPASG